VTYLPSLGRRGEGWVAIQAIILALVAGAGSLGPAWAGEARLITSAVGAPLMLGGLTFMVLGGRRLAANRALTPSPHPRDEAGLVVTGVYGIVRHPIYAGLIIGSFGWGLMTAAPAAVVLAIVLFAFFELKSRREEAWLERRFDGYAAYRARTSRLIPWIGGGRD
jgi:protein-S-isoprenylcysteine O-methyltransferase Ste14